MIPGELVNLRAVERHDAPLLHRWFNDPVVMRGWGWSAPAHSRHEVTDQVEDWLAQEAALGRPAALIAESLEGDPIGLVVLRVDRPEARSVELSLLIDAARWGQGFGTDVLQTALEACFDGWGMHRIGVRVEGDNARALTLYRRLGFREEGRLREAAFRDGRHADIILFALLVPEWAAREEAIAAPRSSEQSGSRSDDSRVELDADAQQQAEDDPEDQGQQGDGDDLDQRGLRGFAELVRARYSPPVDIDRADACSDKRDERKERPEQQRLPRRPGVLGREIRTRGETKLRGRAQTIHVASDGLCGATRDAAATILPDKRLAGRSMMRTGEVTNILAPAQDPSESFDVITADGRLTGRAKPRAEVHRDGDWHRAIHVWVVGVDDRGAPFLMVQRRSPRKDSWPDRLDATVGGHYRAGETLAAALREVEEEIGVIPDPQDLRPLGVRVCANEAQQGIVDREIQDVFLWRDDRPLEDFRPTPAELAALIRFPLETLLPFLAGETPEIRGEAIAPGATRMEPITARMDDFIPTVDRYFLRVALAAQHVLRGDRYVAV